MVCTSVALEIGARITTKGEFMATSRTDIETNRTAEQRAAGYRMPWRSSETRPGYRTTELLLTIAAIVAILVATYVSDANLGATAGWRYASWIAVAYIVSRGLAKVGSEERSGEGVPDR
jgi:hypothetical protein